MNGVGHPPVNLSEVCHRERRDCFARHDQARGFPRANRRPISRLSIFPKFANLSVREFWKLVISPPAEFVAAAATATATAAGAGKICTRGTSFIDGQRSAIKRLAIQASDRPLRILAFGKLNKAEAAGRSCHLVSNHHRRSHLKACIGYKFTETCIGCAMG